MEQIGKERLGDGGGGRFLEGPQAETGSRGLALVFAVADGNDFDFAIGETLRLKAELFGCPWGDVDNASGDERTAIVDPHFETFTVLEIRHLHHAGDGQGLVGGGDVPRHHLFAEGGVAALETQKGGLVIPRSNPALLISQGLIDRERLIVDSADGVAPGLGAFIASVVS